MVRRETRIRLEKTDRQRSTRSAGRSDVEYRAFECPAPECGNFIVIRASELSAASYSFSCAQCGEKYGTGDVVKLFDWTLTEEGLRIDQGTFELDIDDYVKESASYKYCILCNTLKPFEAFGLHRTRKTGRQSECRECKTRYNHIKNSTRTQDQHRESAERRRIYVELGGTTHFDQQIVRRRFDNKCFQCGVDVADEGKAQFDHTLPVLFLWPMTSENATLLCGPDNGAKGARWPSEVYSERKLRELSVLTGYPYDLLAGLPSFNPGAIAALQDASKVQNLLTRHAHYRGNVLVLRNRILEAEGYDFFEAVPSLSQDWKTAADLIRSTPPQE